VLNSAFMKKWVLIILSYFTCQETKKKEVIAELKAAHLSKVEKYEETIRKQRKDFHDGLQAAYGEVTKLAAQRDEYYANWKRLEGTLEAHKRKLHAALS